MLRLILFRHAKADRPAGVADFDRPLAVHGRAQSEAMGAYMAQHQLVPDLAIVSTSRRTQETWQLALPAFAVPIAQSNEPRIYEASETKLLQVLRETNADKRVLLMVGHNPGMEQLAGYLISNSQPEAGARLRHEYPPAGLAVIDFHFSSWADLSRRSGYLERFETSATIGD